MPNKLKTNSSFKINMFEVNRCKILNDNKSFLNRVRLEA